MKLDLGQWITIGICAILILGYIRGYYKNRKKALQISEWLQNGLTEWGQVTPGERLPGLVTGGRLDVNQATEPFQRIEAIFLLEPRENLLFWLFGHLLGKRDELILKINLRSQPEHEVEMGRRGDRDFSRRLTTVGKKLEVTSGPHGLQIARRSKKNSGLDDRFDTFVNQYGQAIVRFFLRRGQPHLFVRVYLPTLQTKPAGEFLSALQNLAK
jgi:hypothetical protein